MRIGTRGSAKESVHLLRWMQLFARAARRESFSLAASDLGLSVAHVSTSIKRLETYLGVRLVERDTRSFTLTPEGHRFLEHSNRLIDEVAAVEADITSVAAAPKGRLRIDAPAFFSRLLIIPLLPDFTRRYAGIDIEMVDSRNDLKAVWRDADIALRVGPFDDTGLVARPLGKTPMVLVAAPSYLAEHVMPERMGDLREHRGVMFSDPDSGNPYPWVMEENGRSVTIDPARSISFAHSDGRVAAALAGLGIMQGFELYLRDHVAKGELVPILTNVPQPVRQILLVYPVNRLRPTRVQVMIDLLQAAYDRDALL